MITPPRSLAALAGRALRGHCPTCGGADPFINFMRMKPKCDHCSYVFERESGYYLGSIYINYGLTASVVTLSVFFFRFVIDVQTWIPWAALLFFCVVFPLWFFRYSRLLWTALDLYWDPPQEKDFSPSGADPIAQRRS